MANKVFVDTSVWIAAVLSSSGGSYYALTNLSDKVDYFTNKYVISEAEGVLSRKFPERPELYNELYLLLSISEINLLNNPSKEDIENLFEVITKKDTPILVSALNNTDFLLTLDEQDFFQKKVLDYAASKNLKIFKPKHIIEKFD